MEYSAARGLSANFEGRCFTNHALDQFLEHLLKVGIDKIIRIGSQSKSTLLEGFTLSVVSKTENATRSESYRKARCYERLEEIEQHVKSNLGRLHGTLKQPRWETFRHHLKKYYPSMYARFSEIEDEGYEVVGNPFATWMRDVTENLPPVDDPSAERSALSQILAEQGITALTGSQKRELLGSWIEEIREDARLFITELSTEAEELQRELNNVHEEARRQVLATADVIGVTTSGLAKSIATLRRIKCKVIICKEAGEVLKSHILSALSVCHLHIDFCQIPLLMHVLRFSSLPELVLMVRTVPSAKHFIQIGDHQQLRHKVNNFRQLSLESKQGALYQLDRSQFERLSINENGRTSFSVAQLNVQRRMRPEISTLIRETICPRLLDHDGTKNLPDIIGMRQNVFFLDHGNMEERADREIHQKSHSNNWEVDLTHALVRHIVSQGAYSSEDVAVLTPYAGQLQKLRTKMHKEFEIMLSDRDQEELALGGFNAEDVVGDTEGEERLSAGHRSLQKQQISDMLRWATVDNFQGEEAKIVIISLVRRNGEGKVGFLRSSNRINVLLSRAKQGMYLIGNRETYCSIPMWNNVISMLDATSSVSKALKSCCPRHPETDIAVSEPDDFDRLSPVGGCRRRLLRSFQNDNRKAGQK